MGITQLIDRPVEGSQRAPLDTGNWRPADRNRELVRYAIMAANSHNTQPWLFDVGGDAIVIHADKRRRCPVVDPDDHHLYVSLGCAAENIVIAATGFGVEATAKTAPDPVSITIDLQQQGVAASPLIAAIPLRQSSRGPFDGTPLTASERADLSDAAARAGVEFHLVEGPKQRAALREIIVAGNADQMSTAAFRKELLQWLRFSTRTAEKQRDGLFGRSFGNPSLPEWLGRAIFPLVFRVGPETAKLRDLIDGASALAVFVSARDTPENWIETGRAFQRFALTATTLDLLHAHVNQAVEVPKQRERVANLLGLTDGRPSLILRIGRGNPMPYSFRRDPSAVMNQAEKGH